MISNKKFMTLSRCPKCRNRGFYVIKCDTEELMDEHGVEEDHEVSVKCSTCRLHKRRREMFLDDSSFIDKVKLVEISDYKIPGGIPRNSIESTEKAVKTISDWCSDMEAFINWGGFALIIGNTNTGKSIFSTILARESFVAGYRATCVSLNALSVSLSHNIRGEVAIDSYGDIVFNVQDYISPELLIVDDFHMINQYFAVPNIRRALVLKIFTDRLHSGKTTVVLMQETLADVFSDEEREMRKFPLDFPSVISKEYKALKIYGRFKKEKTS